MRIQVGDIWMWKRENSYHTHIIVGIEGSEILCRLIDTNSSLMEVGKTTRLTTARLGWDGWERIA